MNANLLKFIAGIVGLAVWAWLAFLKMTPIEPLIDLLKMALGGLVVHMLQADDASAPPAPQGGFASIRMLAAIASVALGLAMLSGCGALNTFTGAALNYTASNGAGAIQNLRAAHDQEFILWTQAACNVQLGALSRNATGNPGAVRAALEACPVPSMGLIDLKNGTVTLSTPGSGAAPTPAAPFTPPAK